MLQDLDALNQRIRQVVHLTRGLQAERGTLQARVSQLEQECQSLKEQQRKDREEFTRMSERVARHDQEMLALQGEADHARADLEAALHEHREGADSLRQRLSRAEAERDKLREVAIGAQQQIELILERLPGAEA